MPRDGDTAPPARRPLPETLWRDRLLGRALLLGLALALLWLAGLIRFAAEIPPPVDLASLANSGLPPRAETDGIVVLTGGSGRIDAGLELLELGLGRALLISGVGGSGQPPRLDAFAAETPGLRNCCLTIGRARDTHGNATETADWMRERGYRSIRLVTATYHMPRSLWEFRHILPAVNIVPHPIGPDGFNRDGWWYRPMSLRLVLSEYHKFLAAWLRRQVAG